MDKTAIKNFAVWARKKLIEDIKQKAYEIGITDKETKEPEVVTSDTMIITGRTLNRAEIDQRESLVARIRNNGFDNVIEEVAYTWFNRLIALRFMEVNGYLPSGIRVLSSVELGKKEPDIIKEALNTGINLDREMVYALQHANDTDTLFRYLLVKQCNALNEILPELFEEIADYTEILLPSNLLGEGSVIRRLVDDISEDDFRDQVEIIGWMYQYYISEKKDEVFAGLKKNIKITKENIPAATQLFTPDWIVKYMVENSLGRLWLEGHPNDELKSKWRYYLDEAEQEIEVQRQLDEIHAKSRNIKPEDIKVLDPAMGSGHILVYAFDVLYDIYRSAGYSERDIPRLILENNLYGLEIDDRAAQLAYFAVMMKARSKDRRIFREKINLNICSIQESNGIADIKKAAEFFARGAKDKENENIKEDFEYLLEVFWDAKEYGSILEVKPIDLDAIEGRLEEIRKESTGNLFELEYKNLILKNVPALIKQARIMSQKYDVVVTNPPYMGRNGMGDLLKSYIDKHYTDEKSDMYSVFIKRCCGYCMYGKYISMITQHSWMFLTNFELLRKNILNNKTIVSMTHLGVKAFQEISGEVVQTVAFVIANFYQTKYKGVYIKLTNFVDPKQKEIEYFNLNNRYFNNRQMDFGIIPGMPIAYWVGNNYRNMFKEGIMLERLAKSVEGIKTGNNDKFLRLWYEVNFDSINYNVTKNPNANNKRNRWFPITKGGGFRKWYGNNEYVINWLDNGKEVISYNKSTVSNKDLFFTNAITWSYISSYKIAMRYLGKYYLYNNKGPGCYINEEGNVYYLLSLINSKIGENVMSFLAPTLDYKPGNLKDFPVKLVGNESIRRNIDCVTEICCNISKTDWDSFETSWDFKRHPLLTYKGSSTTIGQAYNNWADFTEKQFNRLKANEEELNRIFIEIYGLQDELTPEVDDRDITIRKADRVRDIKSFISYAVGCMFGRYSIDAEGLIYAGGDFKDRWRYENGRWKVRKMVRDDAGKVIEDTWVDATFAPDMDNILPITDDEYFEDDIVSRFIEFLKATFGEETLETNLDYIADTLGKKSTETSRQAIRRYFMKDFYKDHVQVYQNKPIYWLFDSGKQEGFKALIYMHRYDEFTAARVRTDYLHVLQKSYESVIRSLDIVLESNASQKEKTDAKKKKEKILKQTEECRQYDQIIAHIANQRIYIDLDDGVSVNYAKFQGVEIPQGEGRKPLTADLLAKI